MKRAPEAEEAYKQVPSHGSPTRSKRERRPFTFVLHFAMVFLMWKALLCLAPLVTLGTGQYRKPRVEIPLLQNATLEELNSGLEAGLYTSEELVIAYSLRIEETNGHLKSVTQYNDDAIQIAQALDAERKAGHIRGPLHGIPVLVKNNIATLDTLNNTAGSTALLNAATPRDATVISKLRAAGAIILGKSNLSQWANFRSYNSSNGWSAQGGQVIGPYYANQDPCGSSSGSGVATTVGLTWASLGTETDGSILCPSSFNNIVGIKPTVGLTSRALVIPISERQDTIGPMARTVKDAAHLLQAIAGQDKYDNYTSAIPFPHGEIPDYVAACDVQALRGARIGIPRQAVSGSPDVLSSFNAALSVLAEAGATVVDNVTYTGWEAYVADGGDSETKVLMADFVANLASYLDQLVTNPQNVTTLADIRNYTQTAPVEDYPDRDTGVFDASLNLTRNVSNTDAEIWDAYQRDQYFGGEGGLLGALDRYNLDAVVLPTDGAAGISAIIGGPVITVPLGAYSANTTIEYNSRGDLVDMAPGIPFGISFAGRLWSEERLVGLAYAFEQRTMTRKKVRAVYGAKTELEDVLKNRGNKGI